MSDDFIIKGIHELHVAIAERVALAAEASLRIVQRGQAVVEKEAKSGFKTSHSKGTPTNSSPGEPPSVVTGTLRDSIKSDRPQSLGGTAVRGTVMPKAVYARIQELGGVAGRGSHLPARPYMRPAHQRVMEVLNRIAVEEWNKL